jgi:hypothetical protein
MKDFGTGIDEETAATIAKGYGGLLCGEFDCIVYMYVYVCMYIFICINIYIYIYIFIHIHTNMYV